MHLAVLLLSPLVASHTCTFSIRLNKTICTFSSLDARYELYVYCVNTPVACNAVQHYSRDMNWISKIFSEFTPKRHLTNSNSGKTFHEKYNDLGAFEYDERGFKIQYEDFTKQLAWTDITQLNVYKVDQLTIDRIDMEIVYGDKVFTISEELPGWYQFVLKIKEVFPTIPKDWDIKLIQPAFATNYTTIYDKTKLNHEQAN